MLNVIMLSVLVEKLQAQKVLLCRCSRGKEFVEKILSKFLLLFAIF
jgi:hypothetical protein